MKRIEFSHMLGNTQENLGDFGLKEFEFTNQIQVERTTLQWDEAWDRLLKVALYQKGPDVSEVGTTWMGSLMEMQALRPFSSRELRMLGDKSQFVDASWETCSLPGDPQIWAAPWYFGLRLFLYRRDILAEAGVEASTAFDTAEHVMETLRALKAYGIEYPLLISKQGGALVHEAAMWIWEKGGAFRDPGGMRLRLNEPEALAGFEEYLRLHPFVVPGEFDPSGVDRRFCRGEAPVALGSEELYKWIADGSFPGGEVIPELTENIGVAAVMHAPFIGGSNLVVWRHTLHSRESHQLIRYLMSERFFRWAYRTLVVLPAQPAKVEALLREDSPEFYEVVAQTLEEGRTVPGFHRWASIEVRLNELLEQMWHDLAANPDLDIEKEVQERVTLLVDRLEQTTLASW